MAAEDVIARIRSEIIDTGRDTRYPVAAYLFVLNGLEFYLARIGQKRHVSGSELTIGMLQFAVKQFGPLAYATFLQWNIKLTDDLGYLVYNLIDIGLMHRQDNDKLEDFFNICSLEAYFKEPDYYEIDRKEIKTLRGA